MKKKTNLFIVNLNIHEHLISEKKFKHRWGAEKTNKNYYNSDNSYNWRMEIQKHRNENRNSEIHWENSSSQEIKHSGEKDKWKNI